MKPYQRWYALAALAVALAACRDRAPEKPAEPPLPSTSENQASDEKPTFVARINAGGQASQYQAFFDDQRLARVREIYETTNVTADYHFDGARLMKYVEVSSANAPQTELQLDSQGRVELATTGNEPLPPQKIEMIRTRAQTLRSHALAQHASRSHTMH